MSWFTFILCALATFRLSRLFSSEEGPLSLFSRLRRQVPAKTNPGRGVRCPFCLSVWIGSAITAFLWWINEVPLVWTAPYAFALSGASVLLHAWQAD